MLSKAFRSHLFAHKTEIYPSIVFRGQRLDLKKQQQDAQREYAANEALAAKT